ncbi:MAG: alpha/beta hydrolase [Ilumatobacteraceae bacterium]
MVELPDTTLFVEDSGETDLPIVVCLHSLFLDGRMFDGFAAAASGRFRIVRPDFRGQGRSALATEELIDMDTCARDIEGVFEHLGLGPVHLLVQSMGGDVGFRFAARRLDLVRSMVVLGSSARNEPPDQLAQFRQWVIDVGERGFVDDILDSTMAIMFGETTRNDPAQRQMLELWRARIAAVPPTLRPAMSGVIERSSVVDLLPKITVPVLVVSGEEDLPRPPEWADEVVAGLPNAQLFRLPSIGHSPTLEAPAVVEAKILEFLDGVEASSSSPAD